MDPKSFIKGRSRETKIWRNSSGKWFLGEDPISHPNLVQSFHQWVDIAEDGRYCLKNNINWAYIQIQGAPFIVQKLEFQQEGLCQLTLFGGMIEPLDPASLRQDKKGLLYCSVKEGKMTAQFDRYAMTTLSEKMGEDESGIFFNLGGETWRPPIVAEPLLEKTKS